MPTLPEVIVSLLLPFERLFDPRTWRKARLLAVGAILSPGKRTVSSALNILGIGHRLSRVNYICRLASISFAGSPPWPGPVAGLRWCGSWGRKLQDDGVVHDPVNRRGGGHGVGKDALPL